MTNLNRVALQVLSSLAALSLGAWHVTCFAQAVPPQRWQKTTAVALREEIRGPLAPLIGETDAPVTIISFSDYQCPYCRELSGSLKTLQHDEPSKYRVVYRHLAISAESRSLAQAALCASEQNHFAEYHELIFTTRGVGPYVVMGLAEHLGMDVEKFRDCVTSDRYASRIDADVREAERLGVQVTPTLFVNGVRVVGATSLAALHSRLDEVLASSERH